ncbi:MAG TPA: formate dehydrogenase accessory sulfurtransferase FdhD [Chloroflexota bacterium]|nr:formate dehydrogenase accessory sulfurtransferase FdhD [Chloroflexota bacterium]
MSSSPTTDEFSPSTRRGIPTRRWLGAQESLAPDTIIAEEPLQLLLNGEPLTVVMRTPGQDVELALGLLHNEGFLTSRDELASLALPAGVSAPAGVPTEALVFEENVVDVRLARPIRLAEAGWQRHLLSASGCGVCGAATIEALEKNWPAVKVGQAVAANVLYRLPGALREKQSLFDVTGGVHAAGLFTLDGQLLWLAEDVGRHNAVDKLVGRALLERRLPLADQVLVLSGRAGFELVQKAAAAGIPIVASVSAPSSLAVQTAQRFGITLVAFLRQDRMNVYTAPERIRPHDNAA